MADEAKVRSAVGLWMTDNWLLFLQPSFAVRFSQVGSDLGEKKPYMCTFKGDPIPEIDLPDMERGGPAVKLRVNSANVEVI